MCSYDSYSPLQTFPSPFTVWKHPFFWKPLKGLSKCSVRHNYVPQTFSLSCVVLDLLGSGVFGFVQNDIRGNIGECFLIFSLFSTKPYSFFFNIGSTSSVPSRFFMLLYAWESRQKWGIMWGQTWHRLFDTPDSVCQSFDPFISSDSVVPVTISSSGLTFLCRGQFIPVCVRRQLTLSN